MYAYMRYIPAEKTSGLTQDADIRIYIQIQIHMYMNVIVPPDPR